MTFGPNTCVNKLAQAGAFCANSDGCAEWGDGTGAGVMQLYEGRGVEEKCMHRVVGREVWNLCAGSKLDR